jgi:hypothetical protein
MLKSSRNLARFPQLSYFVTSVFLMAAISLAYMRLCVQAHRAVTGLCVQTHVGIPLQKVAPFFIRFFRLSIYT